MMIDEKTKIPLGWAATIIVTIIGVVFNAGIAHSRLVTLEAQWSDFKQAQTRAQKIAQEHELKLQRLDLTLENINKRLESIDRKLDRMERK